MKTLIHSSNSSAARGSGRVFTILIVGAIAGLVIGAVLFFSPKPPAPAAPGAPEEAAATSSGAATRPAATGQPRATATARHVVEGSLEDLVDKLNDSALSLDARKKAITALVALGTPEAMTALKEALKTGSKELREAIADGLAGCQLPEASAMLLALMSDSDAAVVKAAMRGLSQQKTAEAASALIQVLNDSNASAELRVQAAACLGAVDQPGVVDALGQAARQSDDEDLTSVALESLGGLDFSQTQSFFEEYVKSPDVSSEMKVTAIEALSGAQGDPTPFLASLASSNADPEVRAAAAWAMSATEVTPNLGNEVLGMLQKESEADVRLRLYQALRNQESFDINSAFAMVQRESDPSARVAGLDLLAWSLRNNPNDSVRSYFDQTATVELKDIALNAESFDTRQAAVLALTRARTPTALATLQEIAAQMRQPATTPPAATTQK